VAPVKSRYGKWNPKRATACAELGATTPGEPAALQGTVQSFGFSGCGTLFRSGRRLHESVNQFGEDATIDTKNC